MQFLCQCMKIDCEIMMQEGAGTVFTQWESETSEDILQEQWRRDMDQSSQLMTFRLVLGGNLQFVVVLVVVQKCLDL